MKFKRYKINKDSSRVVLHKISDTLIKKNPNVEKEHIITKIKKHEKIYTLCLASIFVLIIISITIIIGTSFKYFKDMNAFSTGNLTVEYSPSVNGIGDIITLDDTFIMDDAKIENNETNKFTITNNSFKKAKYKITIRLDKAFIDLDGCSNKLFSDTNVKFNINKGTPIFLNTKKEKNEYVLIEDVIPGMSTKIYSMNVWIDKDTKYEDNHFHGVIEVDVVK